MKWLNISCRNQIHVFSWFYWFYFTRLMGHHNLFTVLTCFYLWSYYQLIDEILFVLLKQIKQTRTEPLFDRKYWIVSSNFMIKSLPLRKIYSKRLICSTFFNLGKKRKSPQWNICTIYMSHIYIIVHTLLWIHSFFRVHFIDVLYLFINLIKRSSSSS